MDLIPEAVGGVPLHPLVVHAVVVLIPLAALGVIAIALVPKWRARFGVLVVGAAALGAALVPVATSAGEQLADQLGETELIQKHTDLGQNVLYTAVPLLLVSIALWWLGRRAARGAAAPRWLSVLVATLAVLVAVTSTIQIVLVGHSGAKAVWFVG